MRNHVNKPSKECLVVFGIFVIGFVDLVTIRGFAVATLIAVSVGLVAGNRMSSIMATVTERPDCLGGSGILPSLRVEPMKKI
jgi:hypothetical protein